MNTAELTAALDIAPAKLKEWLAAGLPCRKVGRGRQFDAAAVQEWLVTTGLADRPQFVGTMEEAAAVLDIHPRTLSSWIGRGAPAKGPQGYDLDALTAWRAQRYGESDPLLTGPTSPALERYRCARAQREELTLARELQQVRSLEEVNTVFSSFANAIRHACGDIQRHNLAGPEAVASIRQAIEAGRRDLVSLLATAAKDFPGNDVEPATPPQRENHDV